MTEPSRERIRRREMIRTSAVYLVTEEALSAGRRSEEIAEAALRAGLEAFDLTDLAAEQAKAKDQVC